MKYVIVCLLPVSFPLLIVAQSPVLPLPDDNDTIADADTVPVESLEVRVDSAFMLESEEIQKGYDEGYTDGKAAGFEKSQNFWTYAGCGSGFFLNIVGGGGILLIANNIHDHPSNIPRGSAGYQIGYAMGYRETTTRRKVSNACVGAAYGTLASSLILIAIVVYIGSTMHFP